MNIKSFFKGTSGDSFFLIIVRMVTLVFGLLMTRILSGHFSVHDYGTYSQITLLVSTISSLTILGMVDGMNYFFCRESNLSKRDNYVSTIFLLQCIVSLTVSIIVLICTGPISHYFDNNDIKSLMIFVGAMPVLQNMISLLQIMFIAIGKAKHIAIRNFLVSVCKFIAILIACYLFNNITFVLICQVVLEVIQISYFMISLKNSGCKISFLHFDKALIWEILKYCIPMAMFTIIKSLNKDCDKYIIAAMTNTETLAVYTNASKQLPFDIIMISFCTVLLPYITRYISQKNYSKTKQVYKAFLELSYISTGILAIGAICVAPNLLEFLYTEKYISGLTVFVIYILVDILSVYNITLILSAAGKTKTIMFISMGAFVANIGLNVVLFSLLGIIGPALATLIVTAIQGVVILSVSAREMHTNIISMFDWKYLCVYVIESIAIGGVIYGMRIILMNSGISSFLAMCICYLLYIGVLALLNLKRMKRNVGIINNCKILTDDMGKTNSD